MEAESSRSPKDILAGLIFVVIGLAFGALTLDLPIGSARRMGPGFFPLILAVILVALGAAIALQGARAPGTRVGRLAWRGLILVVLTPILFGLTLRGVGLVPAIAGVVAISAVASVHARVMPTVLLAAGLAAFCAFAFIRGLGLPIALVGPWIVGHPAVQPAPPSPASPTTGAGSGQGATSE